MEPVRSRGPGEGVVRACTALAELVGRVMEEDVSWSRPAADTVQMYRSAIAMRRAERHVVQVG